MTGAAGRWTIFGEIQKKVIYADAYMRKKIIPKSSAVKAPSPIAIAVSLVGGPGEAAKLLGFARQNVHRWLKQGQVVPEKTVWRAQKLSDATNGAVTAAEILTGQMQPRPKPKPLGPPDDIAC